MVQTLSEKNLSAPEIVAAVAGLESADEGATGPSAPRTLTEQIARAETSFTDRWAITAGKVLLKRLSDDARSLPEFEALIVLALGKPRVITKLRLSLSQEGRRLAVLFEHAGDRERALSLLEVLNARLPEDRHVERDLAAMLRKTGNASRLVERYLGRAEQAVQNGEPMEAVPWLQEVLLVDRSRRDVARMIRDLRYQEAELNHAKQRFWKRLTITLLICGVLGSVGWREWDLQMRLRAIPAADETRLDSLNERVGAIDALVEGNPVWLGILPASRERARLKKAAALAHNKLEERGRLEAEKAGLILAQAESARLRGRMAVDRKDLKAALVEFRKALEFGPDGWQHRERLERDIAALSGLFEENVGQ